jgi:hypothetical protein
MKTKGNSRAKFQRRRTLRLTAEEDARLKQQAEAAGISVAEYMRRRFFGGRPIIAKTDDQAIRELRRLGGLLKHNFEAVREAGGAATLEETSIALQRIGQAIDRLGEKA